MALSAKKREKKFKKVKFFVCGKDWKGWRKTVPKRSVGMERKRNPGKPGF